MMKLLPLADSSADVFNQCISRVRDQILKARLLACVPSVDTAEADYMQKGGNNELYRIQPQTTLGGISVNEIEKVYTGRMVPEDSPGRSYYDRIKSIPAHARCPFCGHGFVTEVDHFLAKTEHPAFVVAPINLVASCGDCNGIKNNYQPTSPEDQLLHPYFDNIDNEVWLTATVLESSPPALLFAVSRPASWDDVLAARVQHHFNFLEIAKKYTLQAARELANIQHQVEGVFNAEGGNAVRQHLEMNASSRARVRANSWEAAMYKALSESNWYCNGGFKA